MPTSSVQPAAPGVSLDHKWGALHGRIMINGTQAIARVLMMQRSLDIRAGLNTAGFVSGYRGSPLGNVDTALWSAARYLDELDIRFQPGVNEDLAATAVRGTQQIDALPDPKRQGVFAAWYGKGPGVDRSLDAFKHGNYGGSHPNGGVALFYGDDHGGKSSTVAHHSEQAMASCFIPSLYPADPQELLEYGLHAYAMSRFSGSWVAIKCVNEVVEQTKSTDIDIDAYSFIRPEPPGLPPEGVHVQPRRYAPLRDEQVVIEYRLPMVQAYVRANNLDKVIIIAPNPALAIVTAGKSYADTRQALHLLGLDDASAAALGITILKVGCVWPLDPDAVRSLAERNEILFVVEEKSGFLEGQIAAALINQDVRPRVIGKLDEDGRPLLSSWQLLEPVAIAQAIAERLVRLKRTDDQLRARVSAIVTPLSPTTPLPARSPFFCSGCPHNRSTRLPDGSFGMTGIGCHTMIALAKPAENMMPTHMGAEGTNWIGLAPYTRTKHIFQNMGDGTYYHSGLLAIRAAIAAGVNITYKILYNDAVAMTGGQPVDGPISVGEIVAQVRHEGVKRVVVLSDKPDAYEGTLPSGVSVKHRDELDAVQRDLREVLGCTVLVYEQTCAAEKRRRRKRQLMPDPPQRLFISEAVCEGCGDCSTQSTCVSLTPVDTAFGIKRKIDQSSCNKDFSCQNGFCPSFLTIRNAGLRKKSSAAVDSHKLAQLPPPPRCELSASTFSIMIAGIGGTGVTTVAAVLGMAAHIDGLAASHFDMTGLAQKNGSVFSHLRLASSRLDLHAQRIGRGETDLLVAFDLLAALAPESASTLNAGSSKAVVNCDVVETAAFQFNREALAARSRPLAKLEASIGKAALQAANATMLATVLLGDSIGANMFMVGMALQRGLLPLTLASIEEAIALNGAAVDFNERALALGRLFVADPTYVMKLASTHYKPAPPTLTVDQLIDHRVAHLREYQSARYADRYRAIVARVKSAEAAISSGSTHLTGIVARQLAKLMAYKDEYEVARLLTHPDLARQVRETFEDGARISFNLAPPTLKARKIDGRPLKREFPAWAMRPALNVLKRLKLLRGTMADPFGWTAERKLERSLIDQYEVAIADVLKMTTAETIGESAAILDLPDMIRGFGPVKAQSVPRYHDALRTGVEKLAVKFHRGSSVPPDGQLGGISNG